MMLVLEQGHYVYICDTCLGAVAGHKTRRPRGWCQRIIPMVDGDHIYFHFCSTQCATTFCIADALILHSQTPNKVLA